MTIFVPKAATAGTVSASDADLVLCPGDDLGNNIVSTNVGTLDPLSSGTSTLTYQWQQRNNSSGNVWTNIAGATSHTFIIASTPLTITEDTEIRRLTFATVNAVSCPTGGAGLPSNIISVGVEEARTCLLYTSPSPRDRTRSRMPSSA